MAWTLDPGDPEPPYRQIGRELRRRIRERELQPGEKLPSQNDMVEEFGVARMTIQAALRDLRTDGLIHARQGAGTFVRTQEQLQHRFASQVQRSPGSDTGDVACVIGGNFDALRELRSDLTRIDVLRVLSFGGVVRADELEGLHAHNVEVRALLSPPAFEAIWSGTSRLVLRFISPAGPGGWIQFEGLQRAGTPEGRIVRQWKDWFEAAWSRSDQSEGA